jgi:hypothetical protein
MSDTSTRLTYLAVIPFLADDDRAARHAAASYAEGLGMLCPEVDFYRARVQRVGEMEPAEVFCGTPGPAVGEFCIGMAGHGEALLHHDAVGNSWSDAEVPTAPDSIADLDP